MYREKYALPLKVKYFEKPTLEAVIGNINPWNIRVKEFIFITTTCLQSAVILKKFQKSHAFCNDFAYFLEHRFKEHL